MRSVIPQPGQRRPYCADREPESFAPFPAIGAGIGLDRCLITDRLHTQRWPYWASRYWRAMSARSLRGYQYNYRQPRCVAHERRQGWG